MASIQSFFNGFLSFLLLVHVGCFSIFSINNPAPNPNNLEPQPKRRKVVIPLISPSPPPPPPPTTPYILKHKKSSFSTFSSILSYLNHLLSSRKPDYNINNIINPQLLQQQQQQQSQPTSWPLPLSPDHHHLITTTSHHQLLTKQSSSFPSRKFDIFPCTVCGEVLSKPHHLELHQATKHSLSELRDGDSGRNILQIIFRSGWKHGSKSPPPPTIHRILKIHNTPKTVSRFEEYREMVRSRAARMSKMVRVDERCIVDGNERLRFHCSTILCPLGSSSSAIVQGACGSQYCSACGIVRHGFVGKQVDLDDGIATQETSWGAHVSLPEDLEREFACLHVRRAMFVCRVVAGRVGRAGGEEEEEKKGALLFDSVVLPMAAARGVNDHKETMAAADIDDELLVFNPSALLPCFLIIYSSSSSM